MAIKTGEKSRFVIIENIINEIDIKISESAHFICGKYANYSMPQRPYSRLYYHINGEMELFWAEK